MFIFVLRVTGFSDLGYGIKVGSDVGSWPEWG